MDNRKDTPVNSRNDVGNNALNHFLWNALWSTIRRFDLILESTNSKSALIIAFNVFVLSGIVLSWGKILPDFKIHHYLSVICNVLLTIVSIASVFSLWFTFRAVDPFLKTYKSRRKYHSYLFFMDIS